MVEERKYKDVPTSELLDFTAKEVELEDEEAYQKKRDYEDELEHREPFDDIKRAISRHSRELKELREIVEELVIHRHLVDGQVSVPIKRDSWRF